MLRVRPREVMDDLDLETINKRVSRLSDWRARVEDSRLFDAPYITAVIEPTHVDAEAVARLRAVFAGMPRMRVQVWRGVDVEVPLEEVNVAVLDDAACSATAGGANEALPAS